MFEPQRLHRLSEAAYRDLRFALIHRVEGVVREVYFDSAHDGPKPTIGIGFNLRDAAVRSQVFSAFGLDTGADAATVQQLQQLLDDTSIQEAATLQRELDAVMAQSSAGRDRFAFSDGDAGLQEMRGAFDIIADEKMAFILRKTDYARDDNGEPVFAAELATLTSLAYNSGSLIGPGLTRALANGDRASVWYEVRYNSNRGATSAAPPADAAGIAKRRYYESSVFGLYDAGDGAPGRGESEAFKTVWDSRESRIHLYEDRFGAGAARDMVAAANRDYGIGDTPYAVKRLDDEVEAMFAALGWSEQVDG